MGLSDLFFPKYCVNCRKAGEYILNSHWWANSREANNKKIYGNDILNVGVNQTNPRDRMINALANLLFWIMTSSPADRPDQAESNTKSILADIQAEVAAEMQAKANVEGQKDFSLEPTVNVAVFVGMLPILIIVGIIVVIAKVVR